MRLRIGNLAKAVLVSGQAYLFESAKAGDDRTLGENAIGMLAAPGRHQARPSI